MIAEDFRVANPDITKEQITKSEKADPDAAIPATPSACTCITWTHDSGNRSYWKANAYCTVNVTHVRGGRPVGQIAIAVAPPNGINFLMNQDRQNYDVFYC